MKRISLLKILIIILVVLIMSGLSTQGLCQEVLYLTETRLSGESRSDGGLGTGLYEVVLDGSSGNAIVTELAILPASTTDCENGATNTFDDAHIACSLDGLKIYCVDSITRSLGVYDVPTGTFECGTAKITDGVLPDALFKNIYAAAIGFDGYLYVSNTKRGTGYLMKVNKVTGQVMSRKTISGVDGGLDLVFDASGTLFETVAIRLGGGDFDSDFYELDPLTNPVGASYKLTNSGDRLAGLAIKDSGNGNFVGSNQGRPGKIVEFNLSGWVADWPMVMYNDALMIYEDLPYMLGDMSAGPLLPNGCTRTIGYYKNHSWNGATVTISGDGCNEYTIDQTTGQSILSSAKGNDFSMLLAQTITSNINVNDDDTGYGIIREAEELLCEYGVTANSNTWDFPDKAAKVAASSIAKTLDVYFNKLYDCE